jgi:hypothetical protein
MRLPSQGVSEMRTSSCPSTRLSARGMGPSRRRIFLTPLCFCGSHSIRSVNESIFILSDVSLDQEHLRTLTSAMVSTDFTEDRMWLNGKYVDQSSASLAVPVSGGLRARELVCAVLAWFELNGVLCLCLDREELMSNPRLQNVLGASMLPKLTIFDVLTCT